MKTNLLLLLCITIGPFATAQSPTTVTPALTCNPFCNFNTTNEGFSSPSIYSNADDVAFNWDNITGAEIESSGLTIRTASLISPVYMQGLPGSVTVGFRYVVPAGAEYRVRVISSVSSSPLEVLATTANGPVYTPFPALSGTICLLLTDADLIANRMERFEFTFRLNHSGNILFDDLGISVTGGPLPVTFEGFVARKNADESLKFLWNVSKEINVQGYYLESSTNGIQFSNAGYVPATSNSVYMFNYPGVLKENMFFRVRNLDIDGRSKYSPVIKVYANKQPGEQVQVYPVPATNQVTVQHNLSTAKTLVIITGASGTVFQQVRAVPNSYQTQLNIKELPTGIYFVTVKDEQTKMQTVKMIKY